MKYLTRTFIKRLLLFCCLFMLTACPKHIYMNSSYSMSILNDTDSVLLVDRNFNNISMIFSAERGESETLMPGDTLILLDNIGFFDEDNSFELAWEPVKDKDLIIQIFIIPEDLSQFEPALYESRNTKGYDNSFFEESSWRLKKWDNAYGIHRYDWIFSIKDNLH